MKDSVVAITPKKIIAKHIIRKDATERKMSPSSTKKPFKRTEERPDDAERMKDRIEAVALNKEIAQHASRKQLSEAMVLFEKAASLGWANSHTYGAAINANIRCGNVSGAAGLFQKLRSTKGLKIDVITCTTMLKFCLGFIFMM